MSLSKNIIVSFVAVGLFIAGGLLYGENYLAVEASSLQVADPTREVVFFESKSEPESRSSLAEPSDEEVQTMLNKLESGRELLDTMWRESFASQKVRYASPRVVSFTNAVRSGCGVIEGGNAFYCGNDHTIYFDVRFFARMMRMTGAKLESDGDMAVIAILAHEWGHAVQAQTRIGSNVSMVNELQADCLSGAFARYASEKGVLEDGDTQEAAFAFAVGGDSAPWYSVDAHGSSEMRVGSFTRGFQNGVQGCVR